MLLFSRREHTISVDISTHEIDGTLYIQIGGCVMSIQELRKYRQVCVSNASFLYYAEFVSFHCTTYSKILAFLQLIITLFTKSVFTVVCSVGSLVSSILLILSLRIVSRWYNVIVVVFFLLTIGWLRYYSRNMFFSITDVQFLPS